MSVASGAVAIPAAAKVIDLTGHTVIPGLVGLHEHTYLGGISHPAPMMHSALLYLAAGVTTAMTAGSMLPYNELNMKRLVDAGELPGPRLHIAGPYLTGPRAEPGAFRIIESPEDARRVVNYWADEGADWFKILSGPAAVVRAVVTAAHARGLKVTAHLCAVTFSDGARLGIDALQHGFITNSEYVPGQEAGRVPTHQPEGAGGCRSGEPGGPRGHTTHSSRRCVGGVDARSVRVFLADSCTARHGRAGDARARQCGAK